MSFTLFSIEKDIEFKQDWDDWMKELVIDVKNGKRTDEAARQLEYMRTSWTLKANLVGFILQHTRMVDVIRQCLESLRRDETRPLYFEAAKLVYPDYATMSGTNLPLAVVDLQHEHTK